MCNKTICIKKEVFNLVNRESCTNFNIFQLKRMLALQVAGAQKVSQKKMCPNNTSFKKFIQIQIS